MAYAKERTQQVLYKGSEQPMSDMLDAMAEVYKSELVPLEDLHRTVREESKGRDLSGIIRKIRDEEW